MPQALRQRHAVGHKVKISTSGEVEGEEEGEVKERGAEGTLCAGVSHNYTHSHTSCYDLCVGQKFSEINA